MNTTLPEAPSADTYRMPEEPESPQVSEPLDVARHEIAELYRRQQLEYEVASKTPIYAAMLEERRLPVAGDPELANNPLAMELMAVGDEILDIREDLMKRIKEDPRLMKGDIFKRLKDFLFKGTASLSDEVIEKFIIEEERRIGGLVLAKQRDVQGRPVIEHAFHFERAVRQKGVNVEPEDEWIFHDLTTNEMVMYAIDRGGVHKIYDGKPQSFYKSAEKDELADLVGAIKIYRDRLKNWRDTNYA